MRLVKTQHDLAELPGLFHPAVGCGSLSQVR